MKIALLICLLLPTLGIAQTVHDLASKVDPFIGTKTNAQGDHGNTLPGAVRPFGMLYWSPDWSLGPLNGSFYRYGRSVTRGFSLTHLSGPGCGVYGDVPIMPILGIPRVPPPVRSNTYRTTYSHANEVAQPGYYSVRLDSGIRVQLAASTRSGIARFDYPAGKDPHTLLIDLSRNLDQVYDAKIQIHGRKATGWVASGGFCQNENRYRVYFALEADASPISSGTFDELKVRPGGTSAKGPRAGGYMSFAPGTTTVRLKAGISYVSAANAEMNLEHEISGWGLERVRRDARAAWNSVLGHAVVKGGTASQQTVFYTALYHAMLEPSIFNDVNGEYLGFDGKVHVARGRNQYANYSGWDIYRSEVQLITMLFPKIGSDMAQSLVADSEQGGGLPIWPIANDESGMMIGDPSDLIIASINAFGGRNFDRKAALTAMIRGATDPNTHIRLYPERRDLAAYLSKGYVPDTGTLADAGTAVADGASITLEYTSADFAIAQFAKVLGDSKTEREFLRRSGNWRNLFDPETKYIRARNTKGEFVPGFSPSQAEGFDEGNAAQYTWMVPYDLNGLIDALGGPRATKARLDRYFSHYYSWQSPGPYFFIANEPSFGNPWIYNWAGYPWRTQEVVRKTLEELFKDKPDGEPGNDDLGATSSWVIFADLGFFPEIPGVGGFATNSPMFPEVKLMLGNHPLHIVASGAPEKLYVKSIELDGKPIHNWWIDWDSLSKANELVFTLSKTRNLQKGSLPPSYPAPK